MDSRAGWHSVSRRQTVEWSCVVMKIRKAKEKDIPRIMELLGQVLQIHAEIRPDVFIPGTTKYTDSELKELLEQEDKPIYVAAGEDDVCMGYAFCQLKEQPFSTNMVYGPELALMEFWPRTKASGASPGMEDVCVIVTPAAAP